MGLLARKTFCWAMIMLAAWSWMAFTTLGWQWPVETTPIPANEGWVCQCGLVLADGMQDWQELSPVDMSRCLRPSLVQT